MPTATLVSVDWGTTSLRCALLDESGTVLDRRDGGPGIHPAPPTGFAAILREQVTPWIVANGPLPIIVSGMIGSRQGWVEAPYLTCPAGPIDLAKALLRIEADGLGPIYFVPGLSIASPDEPPEVMRGEETQIVGALAALPARDVDAERLFVLPGTHSKWARASASRITSFATYMTGEVFAAMRHHTILGRLIPDGPSSFDETAFAKGAATGAANGHPGDLLTRLFSARTLGLFDRLPPAAIESYLSGLLIGAELAAATGTGTVASLPVTIIANTTLADRYSRAMDTLGIKSAAAPVDCASRGHWLIATAASLLKSPIR